MKITGDEGAVDGPLISGDWWFRYPNVEGEADFSFAFRAVRVARWWNGWAVPVVTRSVASSLADEIMADADFTEFWRWVWSEADQTLTIHDVENDHTDVLRPDADGCLTIDLGWCWSVLQDGQRAVTTLEA